MTQPGIRLQKFLSRAGVASRREGERLIVQGRVKVNGTLVTELGSRVDPLSDRVELDDRLVQVEPSLWIMLNKPRGVLTTRTDERGRRIVFDLLDPAHRGIIHNVRAMEEGDEGVIRRVSWGGVVESDFATAREA